MYEYNGKIVNIVDGDTFDIDIDLGFHIHIHERVRVLNIDTPEKRGNVEKELGLIVTEFAKRHFDGCDVRIKSKKELLPQTDSFGRWLVEVTILSGEYADKTVEHIYTELGVNKLKENYSETNVKKIKGL